MLSSKSFAIFPVSWSLINIDASGILVEILVTKNESKKFNVFSFNISIGVEVNVYDNSFPNTSLVFKVTSYIPGAIGPTFLIELSLLLSIS